ncbi:hypothetical protein [Pseudomonas lopnurensis]|uniref:hypothetical protein n=1 Tax=Pseudomonas lopnurensis TaxID=1477517 RepID=UPI0028A5C01E|nr:hypothetical protein [Pseudomonas lopnurensis]
MANVTFNGTEAELCSAFIEQFNTIEGWTCYPETAGFDVLVAHEDGRQIGVEAKLKLNAKVADQILPSDWEIRHGEPGPDHRIVIVGNITEASRGIARLLDMCGVAVLTPYMNIRHSGSHPLTRFPDFNLRDWLRQGHPWRPHLFDWNPPERCQLPVVVPQVAAGVPSPTKLTPWKESALRVLIQLRQQGYITTKQISEYGISPTAWTRGEKPWLCKGGHKGHWIESEHLPPFDQQHPDAYAHLLRTAGELSGGLNPIASGLFEQPDPASCKEAI